MRISASALLLALSSAAGFSQNLPGSYTTSWIGNTYGGYSLNNDYLHIPLEIDAVAVDAGDLFSASSYDEGGRADNEFDLGGDLISQSSAFNNLAGGSVVGDSTYLFFGQSNGGGVQRYDTGSQQQDGGAFAQGQVWGVALYNGNVYVSENDQNLIQIFNESTLSQVASFTVTNPGRIAVDSSGDVWVTHTSSDLETPGAQDRFTYSGTVDRYSPSGTHLGSITLPDSGQAEVG